MTPDTARKSAVFTPEVFEVATLEQSMGITVTGEAGTSTQERWEKETRFLIDDISKFISPRPDDWVIDYGCGVGRLSKELIDRFGCRVVGIDASRAMRQFAPEYGKRCANGILRR